MKVHFLNEARARRHKRPFSLILLDVDGLKAVNDTHGHIMGNAVLIRIAQLLCRTVRQGDVCARYGGDEFALILPNTPLARAQQIAERLRRKIEAIRHPGVGTVTASLGLAQFEGDQRSGEVLIHATDMAMYRAKQEGKNRVVSLATR